MARIFSPETPLEQAVYAGDHARTLALLRALPRAERACHRSSVRRMMTLLDEARWNSSDETYAGWGKPPGDEQVRAAFAALVVCGTALDVASQFGRKDLLDLCSEFRPDSLQGLAEAMLARSPFAIESVQELIVAGLVQRPDCEDYLIGLISLRHQRRFPQVWAADAGLRDVLPGIMGIEGNSEFNLAGIDKYTAADAGWSATLRRLCEEGVYSRSFLLDRTLDALERDWPQFRSGWFSRFHAELEPDTELLAARAERYLALCHSRIPPTVTLALGVLKRLEARHGVDDASLLDALRPVMHASAKGQVLAALKLVDGRVKRNSILAAAAADLVVDALVHESADVQGQVLQHLAAWGAGTDLAGRLAPYADTIAAVHREAFAALVGTDGPMPEAEDDAADGAARRGTGPISPLDDARRLRPPGDIDALVGLIAHVFENDTDIDAFEVASAALVQAAPLDASHLERLAPVLKRARTVRGPVAGELARLLLALATGTRRPVDVVRGDRNEPNPAQQCLVERTDAWLRLAARGSGLPPLSTATHREGFIAPQALVERAQRYHQADVEVEEAEQVRALLRLGPAADGTALEAARALANGPFSRALRYALGDALVPEVEHAALFMAAARIRHPGADDELLAAVLGDTGPDGTLAARYQWRFDTWSSEYSGKTYQHVVLVLDATPPPRPVAPDALAVHRHEAAKPSEEIWSMAYRPGFGGRQSALPRFSAALVPSCLEAHFADGVRAVGNNLDWWQAQWPDAIYLERLLDPAVAMGPMPTLLLALGLAAKEPGQHALSVDALVATWSEGRLDASSLAAELRALSTTPLVKASRYARSFKAALRADPAIHPLVFTLLAEMVVASPAEPQRDLAVLLEILLELVLAHGHALPAPARAVLQDIPVKGRARQILKSLLAEAT